MALHFTKRSATTRALLEITRKSPRALSNAFDPLHPRSARRRKRCACPYLGCRESRTRRHQRGTGCRIRGRHEQVKNINRESQGSTPILVQPFIATWTKLKTSLDGRSQPRSKTANDGWRTRRLSRKAHEFIGEAMPPTALSPRRVGMRSRSPRTMANWPKYITKISANADEAAYNVTTANLTGTG